MPLTKQNIMRKPEKSEWDGLTEFGFDDGYEIDLKIAEILEKNHIQGTFYIILDKVGQKGFLNWDQIKELDKRGHRIGSHTVSHPQDLKMLYDQDLQLEIASSKEMIETVLGHNISRFCYPRGRYDERVKGFVARAGYVFARVTGKIGRTDYSDTLAMPGTIHIFPRKEYNGVGIGDYAREVIDKIGKEGGYCNVWGHGKEIDDNNLWGVLEYIAEYASQHGRTHSVSPSTGENQRQA